MSEIGNELQKIYPARQMENGDHGEQQDLPAVSTGFVCVSAMLCMSSFDGFCSCCYCCQWRLLSYGRKISFFVQLSA